jgi:ureidoacrylate peracid hydrolase
MKNQSQITNRELDLIPEHSALLFVDVQNYCARKEGSGFKSLSSVEIEKDFGYFFRQLEDPVIPNLVRLQTAFRKAHMEVIYTTIESLTLDGRDRSLDYKITGFNIPKGSWDGRVIDELTPDENEIWLAKSSSSVFISTSIDYILRNLDIKQLVIVGILTDQCVESAVRDACDLGYLVTLVTDACTAYTNERHENSLSAISGYCRQRTTAEMLTELGCE